MTDSVILMYHSLDRGGSVISVSPECFARQMEFLAESGTPVLPLGEIRGAQGAVAITFDDAFRNVADSALPVLQKYRFPATVFVVSGYCGGRNNWPSQPLGIPLLPLMSWDELRGLAGTSVTVGAHTVGHPNLTRISPDEAAGEIRDCRARLEDRLGQRVSTFAYPYGSVDAGVRRIAAEEFALACGTVPAFVSTQSDAWNLPRIDAYYLRRQAVFEKLLTAPGRGYIALRRAARRLRALAAA